MKHDIKIIKTGSFFDIDSQGYIINPASDNKIQEKWRPAIEYIINAYKEEFGNKLKNVYVRGSVSKGMALENISDLDMFAYVHLEKEEISSEWSKKLQEKFIAKYSFINGVDIMTKPVSLESKGGILLNQSLCVFGEKTKVEKLKIGKDLILHTPGLQKRFVLFEKFKENNNDKEILEHCVFQMKGILRVGLEILIE
ncbi:MAG: nucleotidyltransferase domain-containing protein, partial [Minisyncoccia bacterium]